MDNNDNVPVPDDLANAGHDTDEPQDDSPESLDEEIRQGADREKIDPHHSVGTPESTIEPLPEDNDTPASPPTGAIDDASADINRRTESGVLEPTHPATDTGLDTMQQYDEGLAGAAEASEPNPDNAVTGYNPDSDIRKQDQANEPSQTFAKEDLGEYTDDRDTSEGQMVSK